jgi:hypothetical protein
VLLSTLIAFAAEEGAEPSKTLFYVCGGALVAFAVIVGALGIRRHETFPPSDAVARGLMLLAVGLVALTMASAVITG